LYAAAGLERVLGRVDKAIELVGRSVALDPLSGRAQRMAALIYLIADRRDDAVASFQLALDLEPNRGLNHAFLATARMLQGHAEDALRIATAEAHDVFRNLALAMIHHALGHTAESDAALATLSDRFGWTAAYQVAEAHGYRNEVDKAFEWLERACAQRDPGVIYTATDPLLRPLRGDRRWPALLRSINLA
jgi:tetratricopeptide (TPR) repeat protein